MKEVLRHMRKSREKCATHERSSKTNDKDPLVKVMAKSVVDFLTEGMRSSHDTPHRDEMHIQTCTSPPIVAAAMGKQQIRGQVSNMLCC